MSTPEHSTQNTLHSRLLSVHMDRVGRLSVGRDVTVTSLVGGYLLVTLLLTSSSAAGEDRDCVGQSTLSLSLSLCVCMCVRVCFCQAVCLCPCLICHFSALYSTRQLGTFSQGCHWHLQLKCPKKTGTQQLSDAIRFIRSHPVSDVRSM